MRAALHHASTSAKRVAPWPIEVARLLEEHHLCAWSESARQRDRYTTDLASALAKLDDTDVCTLDGTRIRSLDGLCEQLESALGVGRVECSIDGRAGVVWALRRRPQSDVTPAIKRRYIIWHEAHVLLREDPVLFGRAVDAIAGVAAEHEFFSDDVLLIQRGVFVGRPALDVYAEDPRGQFRAWFREGTEMPLWRIVSGRPAPKVARWRIGQEVGAA